MQTNNLLLKCCYSFAPTTSCFCGRVCSPESPALSSHPPPAPRLPRPLWWQMVHPANAQIILCGDAGRDDRVITIDRRASMGPSFTLCATSWINGRWNGFIESLDGKSFHLNSLFGYNIILIFFNYRYGFMLSFLDSYLVLTSSCYKLHLKFTIQCKYNREIKNISITLKDSSQNKQVT